METNQMEADPNLIAYLKNGPKLSYKERFLMANRLYKINKNR